jgi:hypothetical protein
MDIIEDFDPGELVIEEGTKGTAAYVILSGRAEVLKKSGKKDITIATLEEGQVFGEMGLIEERPRSATVRAVSDLKVRVINRDKFNELLRSSPLVLIPILKILFERLRQTSTMLAERITDSYIEGGGEGAYQVVVEGKTAESKAVLDNGRLLISRFPFLIGRYSINPDEDVFNHNDLFIREEKPYMVSRNHLAIIKEDGKLWIVDRGSTFGTIVNGRDIGGRRRRARILLDKEENQIIIGPPTSRFIFLLRVIPI